MTINATLDKNGYLENFAIIGTVDGGMDIDVPEEISEEDLMEKGSCFKYDSETQTLTFDDPKHEQQVKSMEAAALSAQYIPSPLQSVTEIGKMMLAQMPELTSDDKLRISGVYDTWQHEVVCEIGDVYNDAGQTWECYARLDPTLSPGVTPDTPAWRNFFKPLHGKSVSTARPFVAVQGAYDLYKAGEYMVYYDLYKYKAGEYMVYTDGKIYKCKQDTNFSPDDYKDAWEVVEAV